MAAANAAPLDTFLVAAVDAVLLLCHRNKRADCGIKMPKQLLEREQHRNQ